MRKKIILSVFSAFLAILPIGAQTEIQSLTFKTFTIKDGLGSNNVNSIVEDRDGLIWMATDNGLCRFDGYDIVPSGGSEGILYDNAIRDIGMLGDEMSIVTAKGAFLLNRKSMISKQLSVGGRATDIRSVIFLNDHILLAGGPYGLFEINRSDGSRRQLKVGDGENNILNDIQTLFKDSSSNIWIGTGKHGVFLIPCGSRNVSKLVSEGLPDNISVTCFAQSGDRIFIGTWSDGIYVLSGDGGGYSSWHVKTEPLGWRITYSMAVDGMKRLWVGTPTGVHLFGAWANTIRPLKIKNESNRKRLLSIKEAKFLFADSSGNIWVSSYGHGLTVASPSNGTLARHNFESAELPTNEINAIFRKGSGELWLGIKDLGLAIYNPDERTFQSSSTAIEEINPQSGGVIGFVDMPNRNKVLIATALNGLFLANLTKGGTINTVTHYPLPWDAEVRCLYKITGNNIWVGTDKGALLFNWSNHSCTILDAPDMNAVIGRHGINALCQDEEGNLWIGTDGDGLRRIRYDYLNMKMADHSSYTRLGGGIGDDDIQCIFQDSRTTIWAGTRNGGLFKYDKESDTFRPIANSELFPSQEICAITEDIKTDLWISTGNGILCYSQDGDIRAEFTGDRYLPGAVWAGKFDVWFGSYNGMTRCDVLSATKFFEIRQPLISSVKINGTEASGLEKMPPFTSQLTLQHNQKSLTLTYASPGLESDRVIRYAHKLSRPDKQWNYDTPGNRTVSYSNLAPGKYKFNVIASTKPGIWTKPTTLTIRVKPAPWASIWAIILYLVIVTGAVMYILRMRKKQYQLYEDMDNFRQELTTQSVPGLNTDLDKQFIDKIVKIIEEHLSDSEFDIEAFNSEMNMSSSTLYRKIKSLTGMSPKEFARSIRFKYACKFLMEESSNITDVAYMTGFSNSKYFSQSFKKEFGMTPSQYIKQNKK